VWHLESARQNGVENNGGEAAFCLYLPHGGVADAVAKMAAGGWRLKWLSDVLAG